MNERFNEFLFARVGSNVTNKFLAAVSGGVDSIVLCQLLKESGVQFAIAHVNFNLRGEESIRDEQFVRTMADHFGVEIFVDHPDTKNWCKENKVGIQEGARIIRYTWFGQLMNDFGFTALLTAHHADDNIETVLMNFFRGTGLNGFSGMPEKNKANGYTILRPMLQFRRVEILEFAKERQISWVEDSSNSSLDYTRNYFRQQLIPSIREVFPNVEENILRQIARMKEVNEFYKFKIEELAKKVIETNGAEVRLPVRKLLKYRNTPLLFEILRKYGFNEKQVDEVWKLCSAQSGRFVANQDYRIIRHGLWFIIAGKESEAKTVLIENDKELVSFSHGQLEFEVIEKLDMIDNNSNIAQLNRSLVEFPLILRKWKAGDYFYPLGMPKKKKLARFLIDSKLSKNEKENVCVIESRGRIVWVVGHRIDHRFRVTSSAKSVLQIRLSRSR